MKNKIQEKLKKHYPILVNGHTVPILSHKIYFYNDNNVLEIKTKIRSTRALFYYSEILKIELPCDDENQIYNCQLATISYSPSVTKFLLHIID